MVRVLLLILSVLVAAMAFVMGMDILYQVAGGLVALALLGSTLVLRRKRKERKRMQESLQPADTDTEDPEDEGDELRELGIVAIRSLGSDMDEELALGADDNAAVPESPAMSDARQMRDFVSHDAEKEARRMRSTRPDPRSQSVLSPLLEGLRVAIGAHAVGLARRYKDACEYRLLASAGEHWAKARGDIFRSGTTPLMPDGVSVSLRSIGKQDLPRRSLSYSSTPAAVQQMVVASEKDPPLLLFADTTVRDGLAHERISVLMSQFVATFGVLLRTVDTAKQADRPRLEIIAEEMARARSRDQGVALALAILNRAEQLTASGQESEQKEAEALMVFKLKNASPNCRVLQVGPLTFGIFIYGGFQEVEYWDRRAHNAFENEEGLLGGGISIGVSILQARHKIAQDWRNEAKHALIEAYTTGVSSVLADPDMQDR